jgi:rhodanese-related sulfurtransferase
LKNARHITMIQISPDQLQAWFASQENAAQAMVLDVRETHEFATASPKPTAAYELVQMPMAGIPARLDELDKSRPIACLCHHGARSYQVAMFLENMGYGCVANISGGIDAWSQQIDPSVPRY